MSTSHVPADWVLITGSLGLKDSGKAQIEIGETYARLGMPYGCARRRYGLGWALYRVPRTPALSKSA